MQKIVVMPVKNEDWILDKTLTALSLWADLIIVADQNSTDGSREIYKKFPKVRVVDNPEQYHSSNVRKLLLDEARKQDGQKIIFSFDADEIPTAEILQPEFWGHIEKLSPGSSLEMQWLNLWRSPMEYRDDSSVWSNSWKIFGFVDDGKMQYGSLNVINDHAPRVPEVALTKIVRLKQPKVMHYQFTNWPRLVQKQQYYRMTEFVQRKDWLKTLKINKKYFPATDERGIKLSLIDDSWISPYVEHGIDLRSISQADSPWFELEKKKLFQKFGRQYFAGLDIWPNIQNLWEDPRSILIKFYHGMQPGLYSLYNLIYAIFKLNN